MNVQAVLKLRRAGGAGGPPLRLGEILVGQHALDQRRLEVALARQTVSGRRLGDLLVARGWASGGAVAGALAEQWGFDFADLESDPPDGGLVRPEMAEHYLAHRILPWRRIDGVTVYVKVNFRCTRSEGSYLDIAFAANSGKNGKPPFSPGERTQSVRRRSKSELQSRLQSFRSAHIKLKPPQ